MLASIVAALLLDGTAATPAPALTPAKILANARLAMYLHAYPRYVAYVIDVQSTVYGKHYHEGYRALLRTHDDVLNVRRAPIYTSNQPVNAYGFSFFGLNKSGKPRDHIPPPFGVPVMSATYDFGLARGPPSRSTSAAAEAIEQLSQPPVIGRVSVSGGDYDAVLLGTETLDGVDVYHLSLTPLRDPDRNRVRELWVDVHTFDVWKLVTDGIFPGGPPAQVPWTVTFIHLHERWLIRTESTTATLKSSGHLFGGATEYHGVNYTFGAYAFPEYIIDLDFAEPVGSDAVQQ